MSPIIWIFVVLLISLTTATDVNDPFAVAQNPCSQINHAQYVCVDCMTLGYCSQINGAWETITVGTCSGAFFFCNENAKGCTYSQQCELAFTGPKFQCQNPGIYPDPYNCKYYHECSVSNQLKTSVCNNGLGYSLQTGTCSLSKSSKQCQERQYECVYPGQMGVWPSDDNIFYICLLQSSTDTNQPAYYPLLYRCPVGQIFADYRCVQKNGGPTSCTTNTLVPDPSNCRAYYKCYDMYMCPSGTRFDATKQSCVVGSC